MTGSVIVDDHLLLACLALSEPPEVRRVRFRGRLFTSGLWYHRLCRALGASRAAGALSSRLVGLAPADSGRVLASVRALPGRIGLISLRDLAWPMAELLRDHRLNLMQLEALAVAHTLEASICVWEGDRAPPLEAAAESVGIRVVVAAL